MDITKLRDILNQDGFSATIDADGDLAFMFEGGSYYVAVDPDDQFFVRLVFPNFWKIESEDERMEVRDASLETVGSIKAAKVFPIEDNTFATVELFLPNEQAFGQVYLRALRVLQAGTSYFASSMMAESKT